MVNEKPTSEGTCPICGQPFHHTRQESASKSKVKLRGDAEACKTAGIGRERTVYVHLDTEKAVSREFPPLEELAAPEPGHMVTTVRCKTEAPSKGLAGKIWRLFT